MQLRLSKIWMDYDGMLELDLSASSSGYSCRINFYTYPYQLTAFGDAMADFSGRFGQDCVFEVGSPDEGSYCWVRLRAYAIDNLGHSALEVITQRNGAPQIRASCSFSGELEVASINALGRKLAAWANDKDLGTPFSFPDC